jgi:hypothetical protein
MAAVPSGLSGLRIIIIKKLLNFLLIMKCTDNCGGSEVLRAVTTEFWLLGYVAV